MDDRRRRNRREWLLLLLLPFGVWMMFAFGGLALEQPRIWRVQADMHSMIDPNDYMNGAPIEQIEQVRAEIMTQPAWMDTFLTPQGEMTSSATLGSSAPQATTTLTGGSATASLQATAPLSGSPTPGTTLTATPYPTSTIYYPPPQPTNTKKPKPADTPVPSADLSIANTDGVATYAPGGSLTYTIIVSNIGPDAVTGATVQDTFPAQIDTISWTCLAAGGAFCSARGNSNINDSVNIPASGSVTYTVSVTIKDDATGTLTNTATVSGSLADPNNANNTISDQDTWQPVADLSVSKDDSVTNYSVLGSVTYKIIVSNVGPSAVTGATVSDAIPSQVTSWTWTCFNVTNASGCNPFTGNGNFSASVDIDSGGSITYSVDATIGGTASGTMSNTATITEPSGVIDPNTTNNSDTDSDVDNTTLPSCDVTKDVSGTGTVNLTAGKVNCLRFDTSGNDKKISLSGHPNTYVRWDGLNENLSGSCTVHERIFVNASEALTEIGINANGSNETILYVVAEKNGNIDIDLIDTWGGCP